MIKNGYRSNAWFLILLVAILVAAFLVISSKSVRGGSFLTKAATGTQDLATQSAFQIRINPTTASETLTSTALLAEALTAVGYPVIAAASQNGVTVSVLWVYADTTRVAIEYEVDGVKVPDGFMLPCPVIRAVLSENGGSYPEYAYSEPAKDIRTHCVLSGQGTFSVVQRFYQSRESGIKPSLRFEVTIGGMTLYTENGATTRYPQVGVFPFSLTAETTGRWTIEQSQLVRADNMTIALRKIELNPSLVDAYLCIEFQNDKEWIPEASLLVHNDQLKLELYEQVDQAGNPMIELSPTRCFRLTFPIHDGLNSGDLLTVRLDGLIVDAFNVMTEKDCSDALRDIQQTYPEVNFVCYFDSRGGGRGQGFEVRSRPPSMSEDQVFQLLRAELYSMIEGPWDFEVEVP